VEGKISRFAISFTIIHDLLGMEELSAFVDKLSDTSTDGDVIVQQLSHKPGWKEANFQVLLQVYVVIAKIAKVVSVSKSVAVLVLTGAW
jgi:hypothetical protein